MLLRHLAARSPNPADQVLAIRGAEDVSRFLAYGLGHMRALLAARPHERAALVGHLDEYENLVVGYLGAPIPFAALAVTCAGSRAEAPAATGQVVALYRRFVDEHFERRLAAGLPPERSPLREFVAALE